MNTDMNPTVNADTRAGAQARVRARADALAVLRAHGPAPVAGSRRGQAGRAIAQTFVRRLNRCRTAADAGMSTAEYAVGTIAACGFAAVLYKIVTSGPVRTALTGVIEKALHVPF
jgi:hypothetical protein